MRGQKEEGGLSAFAHLESFQSLVQGVVREGGQSACHGPLTPFPGGLEGQAGRGAGQVGHEHRGRTGMVQAASTSAKGTHLWTESLLSGRCSDTIIAEVSGQTPAVGPSRGQLLMWHQPGQLLFIFPGSGRIQSLPDSDHFHRQFPQAQRTMRPCPASIPGPFLLSSVLAHAPGKRSRRSSPQSLGAAGCSHPEPC